MCDKCNDFVFHYLLDYSCRVFVSFLCFFSRFCTILTAHSQKTVDFNRNVCCGGVENSFALVPCFPRGNFSTLCSRPGLNLIPPSCSEWFPSVFVLLFTAFFFVCFGFRTTAKCFFSSLLRGDSLLFPASICCNFLRFTFGLERDRARA